MKTARTTAALALGFLLTTAALHAQVSASVLAQMDAASAKFKSAQANVQQDIYTRVIKDHSLQTGTLYVERSGSTLGMGLTIYDFGDDGKPQKSPSKVVTYDGTSVQMYSPGTNQVDILKTSGNQAKFESYLTLGFGGSGKDLDKAWVIQDQGAETLNDSSQAVKTEKLDLVSKDASVKSTFSHVTIWVDLARGISLKQIFYAPNGDSRTAVYTNIKLNTKVDKKPYAIGSKANKVYH